MLMAGKKLELTTYALASLAVLLRLLNLENHWPGQSCRGVALAAKLGAARDACSACARASHQA